MFYSWGFCQDNTTPTQIIDKQIEQIAIGDAKFGMTWNEAVKCNVFNEKGRKFSKYKGHGIIVADNYIVGNCKYRVRCVFEDDKLNEVTISGYLLSAKEFDKQTRYDYSNLYSVSQKRYGNPSIDSQYPSILDYETKTTMWVYGEKGISLSVKESESTFYTYLSISIVNSNTVQKLSKEVNELKKNIEKSAESF